MLQAYGGEGVAKDIGPGSEGLTDGPLFPAK